MDINVDTKKMLEFAGYIAQFSKDINSECYALNMATDRYAQTVNEEDVISERKMTQNIAAKIEEAEPVLKDIQQKVEGYAKFIIKVKSIAKG